MVDLQSAMSTAKNVLTFGKSKDEAKSIEQSFMNTSAKASAIQKIVGSIMDAFAVGVSKTQKDFVNGLKKGIMEGDLAGFADSLAQMRFQFVDLARLAKPWIQVFEPFNQMLSAVAAYASQAIAGSDEFKQFIKDMTSTNGMNRLAELGRELGGIVMKLVNMDWDKTAEVIGRILDRIDEFVTAADNWHRFWTGQGPATQQNMDPWNAFNGNGNIGA